MSAKTPSKIGNSARSAGTGIPDCAISTSNPMVFSATVLPPVFGPLMMSWRSLRFQLDGQRNHRDALRLQVALQQRMPRVDAAMNALAPRPSVQQLYRRRSRSPGRSAPWRIAVPAQRERRLRLQGRRHARRCAPVISTRMRWISAMLLVEQAHQLVVLLDGLERLDEDGLAAGGRSVRDALHAPALLGLHRESRSGRREW